MRAGILEKRSGDATRQRILEAALVRFARASYEEVKLRDIAGDVCVDVAFVHRSFKSKEQLFAEVFKAAIQAERPLAARKSDLIAAFTKTIFERESDPASAPANALQILVRSLSSPQARNAVRSFVLRDFIGPLAAGLDTPALQRAALITACLAGISILRDVLLIEPLLDKSKHESQPLIERIFGACLEEHEATASPTAETISTGSKTRKAKAAKLSSKFPQGRPAQMVKEQARGRAKPSRQTI